MTLLNGVLDECRGGNQRVVVVRGAVGSGRTRLLQSLADGSGDDVLLLVGAGARSEQDLPFGVLGQLLRSPALCDSVWELGAELIAVRSTLPADARLEMPHLRILESICSAIMTSAGRRAIVFAIDDLDCADSASHQAIQFIERRLRFTRCLIVVSEQSPAVGPISEFAATINRRPGTVEMTLPPLTEDGVLQLLLSREPDASPETARELHDATGGNPMLVQALLVDRSRNADGAGPLGGSPSSGDPGSVPEYFRSVLACLQRLGPQATRVAQNVALLEQDLDDEPALNLAELIARSLDIDPVYGVQFLNCLESAGILAGGRFRHRAARLAALQTIPRPDLAERRAQVASVLFYGGAPRQTVASVLAELNEVDEQWASRLLLQSAEDDVHAGHHDRALQKLKICLRSAVDDDQRAELTLRIACVEWRHDPVSAARYLPILVAAGGEGRFAPESLTQLIGLLTWFGHVDDVSALLAGSAAGVCDTGVDWLSFVTPQHSPAGAVPRTIAGTASRAGRIPLYRSSELPPESAAAAFDEALGAATRLDDSAFRDLVAALQVLIESDSPHVAASSCDRLLAVELVRSTPSWRAMLQSMRADVALREGKLTDAVRWSGEALESLPPAGWGVAVAAPLATAVLACTAMGRHQEAAIHLRTPLPDGMFDTVFGMAFLHVQGRHKLAVGQPKAALEAFESCGATAERWGAELPTAIDWRTGAAYAKLQLGDREAAHRLARTQVDHTASSGSRARAVALRGLAVTLPSQQRVPQLSQAVKLSQLAGDRLTLACALLDLSRAHQLLGDSELARSVGRRAQQLARECEAGSLIGTTTAPRAEKEPAEPVDPGQVPLLSDAEQRVASLIMGGYTNREISSQLFITVSTVEQHLTRIYRKVNVNRRADLRVRLAESGQGSLGDPTDVADCHSAVHS